ncbi:MAG: RNA polymerase sigma factor [Candidatus Kapaibacteriales bacterium]
MSIDNPTTSDEENLSIELTDIDASAEGEILSIEHTKLLNIAIETLPEHYRKVIILRHFDELDYQEIANQLETPVGTVKSHLFRARRHLLQILKRMNFDF